MPTIQDVARLAKVAPATVSNVLNGTRPVAEIRKERVLAAVKTLGYRPNALAASLRRGGLIVPVLVAPLTVPVLIFGVSAANAAVGGTVPFLTPFLILCAISLAAVVVGTVAAAAALRQAD